MSRVRVTASRYPHWDSNPGPCAYQARTRYKLAALTAELWGRGHDIDGVEEADAAGTGGGGSAEVGYPRQRPCRSFSSLCSVRYAHTQAPRSVTL